MAAFASVPATFAGADQSTSAAGPQTYTVVVGAENVSRGIGLMAFFPSTLMIHVGDTVHWVANSNEFHTVTFLAGAPMPEFVVPAPAGAGSPVMANPRAAFPTAPTNGRYDGATFVNSGLMGLAPGQAREFNLTFTRTGTFNYICIVHGQAMSGTIVVVGADHTVPSPAQAAGMANDQMEKLWDQSAQTRRDAQNSIQHAIKNADGTWTHYVSIGYNAGQVDLMSFFPEHFVAHPGDTIVWHLGATDMAPHTVTFYNGHPDLSVITVKPQPNGPPLLLLNPAVLMPQQPGQPLSRAGIFSSGFLDPTQPGPHSYTLKIGDVSGYFEYDCILHDASGMTGTVFVATRHGGD
jgi:plastocyanin